MSLSQAAHNINSEVSCSQCYFKCLLLLLQMQVYTNGNPYGIAEDIVFSMPCRSRVGYVFVIYFVDFCLTRAHWTTPSNALIVQGDGDYELVRDVVFDDFLRERIKKVHFCMNLSSKLHGMLYTS